MKRKKVGLAGLESLNENPAFSVVKDKAGRPVVPAVVPLRPISAELAAKLLADEGA
ncbi:MAG: hypothetical protein WBD20_05155 [Pirellulaceae bacterium]